MKFKVKIFVILLIDLIFSIFAAYNFILIKEKPMLPFFNSLKGIVFDENTGIYNKGDKIISIDNIKFQDREEIEFYTDTKSIGDNLLVTYSHNSEILTKNIKLIDFYSFSYLIVIFIIGLSFFATGIFVLLKNQELVFAYIFHWLTLGVSGMIFLTWGKIQTDYLIPNFILRTFFDVCLILTPITFLHFSLLFPKVKFENILNKFDYIYLIFFLYWFVVFIYNFQLFLSMNSPKAIIAFREYNMMHTYHSKILMIPFVILVVMNYIHSYLISKEEDEKRKLKWIFLGILTGPLIYTFIYSYPRITGKPLISEELMLIMLVISPITFVIAITKYRIIDINFLVKKGLVYSLIIIIFSLLYVFLLTLVGEIFEPILDDYSFFGVNPSYLLISIFAIIIFQPLKSKVQEYIDRKFFRSKYNYNKVLSNFSNKIKELQIETSIVDLIINSINQVIPTVSHLILWRNSQNQVLSSQNFSLNIVDLEKIDRFIENTSCKPIYSKPYLIEEGIRFELLTPEIQNLGVELILNSFSDIDKPKLTFVFGKKKAETKFSFEDIELLNTILHTSAVSIYKTKLQTELILEQAEKEKLKELNETKSFFVSSVSHELKTPLTAIKLYAEVLNSNPNLNENKKNEYLSIIEGECDRLDRLVNNVLGFSKIEKGTKIYNFEFIDLKNLLSNVINTFKYQLNFHNFKLFFDYETTANYTIEADEDALKEVFINIISNSIKYSFNEKEIKILLQTEPEFIVVSFEDKGIGISSKDIGNIFTPFFRSKEKNVSSLGGAGLGLAIVKNIIDAHKGSINVESKIGNGTKFIIKLPVKNEK